MRLSTRGRYAVMAMVELAARDDSAAGEGKASRGQVSLAEIASAQHLSLAYLEQLFGPLRRAGLVVSTRGPGGGYRLARGRSPSPISWRRWTNPSMPPAATMAGRDASRVSAA